MLIRYWRCLYRDIMARRYMRVRLRVVAIRYMLLFIDTRICDVKMLR